jgi:NAD(P)-dependent dehydrogenase (short-subunit alcohol dehydrogenase family)
MTRLQDKTAIITGAASGIGRATALLFAKEGARLLIADQSEGVHETAALINNEVMAEAAASAGAGWSGFSGFAKAIAVQADVSDEAVVEGLVQRAVRDLGGLHVFYANAGISGGLPDFDALTAADWERILRVNLIGPFLAIKHAMRVMGPQGRGSILCTASVAGLRSGAGGPPYSASKAGVISLVQTSANAFGGTGVRINAICPGLIETGMTQPIFERARAHGNERKIGQLNPLRRYGLPNEIAQMALFLASDEASYVNGQAFAVDGGLSSSHPVVPPKM